MRSSAYVIECVKNQKTGTVVVIGQWWLLEHTLHVYHSYSQVVLTNGKDRVIN